MNIHKAAQVHLSLLSLDNLISTKLLLARNALSLSYMASANALASLHIRTGSTEPSSLYQNFMRWLK